MNDRASCILWSKGASCHPLVTGFLTGFFLPFLLLLLQEYRFLAGRSCWRIRRNCLQPIIFRRKLHEFPGCNLFPCLKNLAGFFLSHHDFIEARFWKKVHRFPIFLQKAKLLPKFKFRKDHARLPGFDPIFFWGFPCYSAAGFRTAAPEREGKQ